MQLVLIGVLWRCRPDPPLGPCSDDIMAVGAFISVEGVGEGHALGEELGEQTNRGRSIWFIRQHEVGEIGYG